MTATKRAIEQKIFPQALKLLQYCITGTDIKLWRDNLIELLYTSVDVSKFSGNESMTAAQDLDESIQQEFPDFSIISNDDCSSVKNITRDARALYA
jgi:hypothetical protein